MTIIHQDITANVMFESKISITARQRVKYSADESCKNSDQSESR